MISNLHWWWRHLALQGWERFWQFLPNVHLWLHNCKEIISSLNNKAVIERKICHTSDHKKCSILSRLGKMSELHQWCRTHLDEPCQWKLKKSYINKIIVIHLTNHYSELKVYLPVYCARSYIGIWPLGCTLAFHVHHINSKTLWLPNKVHRVKNYENQNVRIMKLNMLNIPSVKVVQWMRMHFRFWARFNANFAYLAKNECK